MSRRWRIITLSLLLIVLITQIMSAVPNERKEHRWYTDNVLVSLFRPAGLLLSLWSDNITQRINKYFFLADVEEKNQSYASEIQRLKIQVTALKTVVALAEERGLLVEKFAFDPDAVLPARIISIDLFDAAKTMLIAVGFNQGVKINSVVLVGDGLVGRVLQVYDDTSKVLLLIDRGFAVDVVNRRSGARMLVSGVAKTQLGTERQPYLTQAEYLENAREMIKGDILETSGLSDIYPKGLPVGVVDQVSASGVNLFEKAQVLPSVDFTKLTRVFVLLHPRPGA